jgi:beta-mannanase
VIGLILLVGAGAFFGRNYVRSIFFDNYYRSDEPVVALFDRNNKAKDIDASDIEHYKLVWKDTTVFKDKELEKLLSRHDLLITVETWPDKSSVDNVLTQIVKGSFDNRIRDLAVIASKSIHKVFVRLNPDMEVPTKIYPWQYQSSEAYIQAFNYFAHKLHHQAPAVKLVWGPSGYPGDTEYWPGNKEVDFVSITLGSISEYSTNAYPFAKTVPDILKQKLHRLRFIDKPVLVIGTNTITKRSFKQEWITAQLTYTNKHSDVAYSPRNFVDSARVKPDRDSVVVGVYDPNKKLLHQKHITVEHIFTDLGEVQRGNFEKLFREIINRHHDAIVTMEPWKDTTHLGNDKIMANILNGRYDPIIRKLFSIVSSTNQVVYLRWMHEMEIPIHRYAWQSQDPVTYIKAFRYFMQFEGGPGKNVKRVWGPAGDRGSIDFWPGDDVIDYISIAIYGLPDKNITDPNKQEPFSTIFNRKYRRMRFSSKPVFITESGVKGSEAYQDKWLSDAAKTIRANTHVFGICYFNLYDDPKAWGDIKPPDWSITPKSMNKFCEELNSGIK